MIGDLDMGMIDLARETVIYNGFYYYKDKHVLAYTSDEENIYDGFVKGSQEEPYVVHVDLIHPYSSRCNCAFATGKRRICKHEIALALTANEELADEWTQRIEEWEAYDEEYYDDEYYDEYDDCDYDEYYDEEELDIDYYVDSLSEDELRNELKIALRKLEKLRRRY